MRKQLKCERECAYCGLPNPLHRCSACHKEYYCNRDCQVKHWKVEHKRECKTRATMTDEEWEQYKVKKWIQLLDETNDDDVDEKKRKSRKIRKMQRQRCINHIKTKYGDTFTPVEDLNDTTAIILNIQFSFIMDCFDKDEDGKLNFEEWCNMLRALAFQPKNYDNYNDPYLGLLFDFFVDLGWQFDYIPSFNNGSFGSFIYPNSKQELQRLLVDNIAFGYREIIETLRMIAFIYVIENKIDWDKTKPIYDYNKDEHESYAQAFRLLMQLSGYAQGISHSGQAHVDVLYDAFIDKIDGLTIDIVDIIYSYYTIYPHKIWIGWKKIPFVNDIQDQEILYSFYDKWQFQSPNKTPKQIVKQWKDFEIRKQKRKIEKMFNSDNQKSKYNGSDIDIDFDGESLVESIKIKRIKKYDLFYIIKYDEKGYPDFCLNFQVCHNPELCEKLMGHARGSQALFAKTDKCCLGSCSGFMINKSLHGYKEHAQFIGKILEYHQFDPNLCHSIYIGKNVDIAKHQRKEIIDQFNQLYGTKAILHIGDDVYPNPFAQFRTRQAK